MAEDKEYETWKRLGDDLKDVEKRLSAIICNPLYQKLMTLKLADQLARVSFRIDAIKSKLENRMFLKVRPTDEDFTRWLNVFYGRMDRQGGDQA